MQLPASRLDGGLLRHVLRVPTWDGKTKRSGQKAGDAACHAAVGGAIEPARDLTHTHTHTYWQQFSSVAQHMAASLATHALLALPVHTTFALDSWLICLTPPLGRT